MNLSFSTRGWGDMTWEELVEAALDMKFTGIEVYNLWKFPEQTGRGISTDIVGASIHAYINALNKIVYEEDNV